MTKFKELFERNKGDITSVRVKELDTLYDLGSELGKVGKEGKDWEYDDNEIDKDRYTITVLNQNFVDKIEKVAKKLKINITKGQALN